MKWVLVDLDALLDTRFGVVDQLSPEAGKALVSAPAYWGREYDDWESLTNGQLSRDTVQTAYAKRDTTTLQHAMMTGIFAPLIRILTEYQELIESGMLKEDVGVAVNLHPYVLGEDFQDVITESLHTRVYPDLEVKYVTHDPVTFRPEILDANYAMWVTYDFLGWIHRHYIHLQQHPIPSLDILAPKVYDRDPKKLTIEQRQQDMMDFKISFLEYLKVDFIDTAWFSVFPPHPAYQHGMPDQAMKKR